MPDEKRNRTLRRLNALVGEWEMQASVDGRWWDVAGPRLNGWKEGPSSSNTRTVNPPSTRPPKG